MMKNKFVSLFGQLIEPSEQAQSFGGIGVAQAEKQRGSPENRDCLLETDLVRA
jgi:hypothetical protein